MDLWLDSSKPVGPKTTRRGQPAPNNRDLAMRSWEQRESARTGKPVPQVLAELIEQSGGKLEAMGMMAGMTYQAAHRMLVRNGIRKTPILHFEFRGTTAPLTTHCKKHGLSYYSVKEYARRNKVSRADALERYLSGQVRPYRNGASQ